MQVNSDDNSEKNGDESEIKWPADYRYKAVFSGIRKSRLVNIRCLPDIKIFVEKLSTLNNVNFSVVSTKNAKDGSTYKYYRCHHGAPNIKGKRITDTK